MLVQKWNRGSYNSSITVQPVAAQTLTLRCSHSYDLALDGGSQKVSKNGFVFFCFSRICRFKWLKEKSPLANFFFYTGGGGVHIKSECESRHVKSVKNFNFSENVLMIILCYCTLACATD